MLKSLYSGVTGMRSQQTKMDVISNNIANVSTTGFKAGRVRFQDLISQIDSPAQGATDNLGGINPHQIGMGVQVSGTDTIMTAGSLQTTGRALDFGIQNGDNSFFIVSGSGEVASDKQYTRDGGFYADDEGDLVTASGMRVMGYSDTNGPIKILPKPVIPENYTEEQEAKSPEDKAYDIALDKYNTKYIEVVTGLVDKDKLGKLTIESKVNVPKVGAADAYTTDLQSFTIDSTGTIIGTYADGDSYVLGRVALASFNNPDGLQKAGGNLYNRTQNSGDPVPGAPSQDGYGEIRSGFLEMSNVDLANEFTEMIVTSRAYQANSRSITTSDEMIQELLSLKR